MITNAVVYWSARQALNINVGGLVRCYLRGGYPVFSELRLLVVSAGVSLRFSTGK